MGVVFGIEDDLAGELEMKDPTKREEVSDRRFARGKRFETTDLLSFLSRHVTEVNLTIDSSVSVTVVGDGLIEDEWGKEGSETRRSKTRRGSFPHSSSSCPLPKHPKIETNTYLEERSTSRARSSNHQSHFTTSAEPVEVLKEVSFVLSEAVVLLDLLAVGGMTELGSSSI